MAESKKTFEDYLKKYIQNKALSSTKESYTDWLRSNGVDSEKVYTDTLRSIETDYLRAKSEHGTNAERLAKLGLSSSGYSDYINGLAYSDMQNKKQLAREDLYESEQKNLSSYRDYTAEYAAKAEKAFSEAYRGIQSAGITNYEKAYAYAVSAGLGEDGASIVAKLASDSVVRSLREKVMKEIVSKYLTEAQAMEYAKGLGLGEDDAKELSEYAKAINETVRPSDYKKVYPDFYEPKSEQN